MYTAPHASRPPQTPHASSPTSSGQHRPWASSSPAQHTPRASTTLAGPLQTPHASRRNALSQHWPRPVRARARAGNRGWGGGGGVHERRRSWGGGGVSVRVCGHITPPSGSPPSSITPRTIQHRGVARAALQLGRKNATCAATAAAVQDAAWGGLAVVPAVPCLAQARVGARDAGAVPGAVILRTKALRVLRCTELGSGGHQNTRHRQARRQGGGGGDAGLRATTRVCGDGRGDARQAPPADSRTAAFT